MTFKKCFNLRRNKKKKEGRKKEKEKKEKRTKKENKTKQESKEKIYDAMTFREQNRLLISQREIDGLKFIYSKIKI